MSTTRLHLYSRTERMKQMAGIPDKTGYGWLGLIFKYANRRGLLLGL